METITLSTIASDWKPANPSACPSPTDYWQWDYGEGLPEDTVLGGPSQTSNGCLPTSWDGQMTYLGARCPSSYTPACGGSHGLPFTCCPTAYSFSCVPSTTFTNEIAPTFRCMSQYASSFTAVVTRWDVQAAKSTDVSIRNLTSPNHLFALGILYATPPPPTSSSTSTSSIPSSTPSGSPEGDPDGITVGASAGIGAGVACGILLIAGVVGWFLYRRRSSGRHPRRPTDRDVILEDVHGGRGASTGYNDGGVKVNDQFDTTQRFELPEPSAELHL